jgi:DNA-binding Lrp family transcriptional regulator
MGPDTDVLEILGADARASYEAIAQQVGGSKQQVWRRVRALEGASIWGYGAVLDYHELGWRRYVITFPGAPDARMIRKVEAQASPVQAGGTVRVLQSCLVRGAAWRFVVEVAAKNSLAMEAYLQGLRERLGEVGPDSWLVEEVEYMVRDGGFVNPRLEDLDALARGL